MQQLCADTGCSPEDQPEAMNDREKWRERVRDICADSVAWWWWWWYILAVDHQLLPSRFFKIKGAGCLPSEQFVEYSRDLFIWVRVLDTISWLIWSCTSNYPFRLRRAEAEGFRSCGQLVATISWLIWSCTSDYPFRPRRTKAEGFRLCDQLVATIKWSSNPFAKVQSAYFTAPVDWIDR